VACEKHELETVIDFVDAIFNSDAGHCLSFGSQERSLDRDAKRRAVAALINNTGTRPAVGLTVCAAPISGINLPDTIKPTQIQVFPALRKKISGNFKRSGIHRTKTTPGNGCKSIGFDIRINDD
jgi:hypothetical protein